jgi:hypothetical protein
MEKFVNFRLDKVQMKRFVGGNEMLASATADCGGGKSVTCSGSSCRSVDGLYCSCDGVDGELKFCSQA